MAHDNGALDVRFLPHDFRLARMKLLSFSRSGIRLPPSSRALTSDVLGPFFFQHQMCEFGLPHHVIR